MDISEQVFICKDLKHELKLTNQDVANGSGVPLGTVNRFFGNKNTDFRYDSTVKPIYDYLTNLKEPTVTKHEQMIRNELEFCRLLLDEKNERIKRAESLIQTLKNIIVSFIVLSLLLFSVLLRYMFLDSQNEQVGFILNGSVTYTGVILIAIIAVLIAWMVSLYARRK